MISIPRRHSQASTVTSLTSSSSSDSGRSVANVIKRPENKAQNLLEEHNVLTEEEALPEKRWKKRQIFLTVLGSSVAGLVATLAIANCFGAFEDNEGEFASDTIFQFQDPSSLNVPFRNMTIPVGNGIKIKGWLMQHPSKTSEDTSKEDGGEDLKLGGTLMSDRPTLIYLHGDRKDLGWSLPQMARLYNQCNVNVIGLYYRSPGGIDRSQKKVLNARSDMTKALGWIINHAASHGIDPHKIFLYSEGIGADIAAHMACCNPQAVNGLLLDNPRETLPMQKYRLRHWDLLTKFAPDWFNDLLKHYHPSLYVNAAKSKVPICIFANERFSERVAQNIFANSSAQDRWLITPYSKSEYSNAGHPGVVEHQWREILKEFVSRSLEPKQVDRPNVSVRVASSSL